MKINSHQVAEADLARRLEYDHYTNEQGYMVFTERFHVKRGICCGNGCRHCPFTPRHQKGGRVLSQAVQNQLKKTP
ncbi:DUF5522 domain-containing protein [Acanthopleuribacter pedis]|uniref:Uncharacterized protein n=1 Tax=Acanthopleuribacter pedis TaxID=442870 RepID=A0A8J7QC71_9BACT|nr:hypothetical protein [Acanthopleuribacter pedis]